jgi:hypothetical protein
MLLGKLKEPVEKIYQGPGLTTVTVTGEYLAASANDYVMGTTKQEFYYKIGKVKFDEEGTAIAFDAVIRGYVILTEEDFADWGTDDFVVLQAIAIKLGIEVTERLTLENELFRA